MRKIKINDSFIELVEDNGRYVLMRKSTRNSIINKLFTYEKIDCDGNSVPTDITSEIGNEILDRIESGEYTYSSAMIFHEEQLEEVDMTKTESEHVYTSTGIKFWRHQEQMLNYKNNKPGTVISTHISPEGACNLSCPYCSVTHRDTHSRIDLDVIKDYVEKLMTRGLKAVILTGGGEPTLYKHINELVQWIKYEKNLSVALITNGTTNKMDEKTIKAFSWVRVSINIFNGWEEKINFPVEHLSDDCVLGMSHVYTIEHQSQKECIDRAKTFKKISLLATKMNAKYVRILPNCLLEQKQLLIQHKALNSELKKLGDGRFFHQHKGHKQPESSTCHQSYFRPYLSEEKFASTGKAGTIYPCDSVVLNNSATKFAEKFQLCEAGDVLDYLDKKITANFSPKEDCSGCVFCENVEMLGDWKDGKVDRFGEMTKELVHEEFV